MEMHLFPEDAIRAEAGVMIYVSSNIEVKTHTRNREVYGELLRSPCLEEKRSS
ncbi:hypothetical protein CW706_05795 [Candidatus Bathyarchaeota archaeon]|nr:MAG: hypothetical protein CW706_05795 [Candidatus Bathyarchaeota archaeon]